MITSLVALAIVGVGTVVVGSETPGNLVDAALVEEVRVATDDGMALPLLPFLSEDEEERELPRQMVAQMALGRATAGIAVQTRGGLVRLTRFAPTGLVLAAVEGTPDAMVQLVSAVQAEPSSGLAMRRGGAVPRYLLTPPGPRAKPSRLGKIISGLGGVGLVLDAVGAISDWAARQRTYGSLAAPLSSSRGWTIAGAALATTGLVGATILIATRGKHRRR